MASRTPDVDWLAVLQHLARRGRLEELQALFLEARERVDGEQEMERLDALQAQAMELHDARGEDQRRALGLTALSDTAADLATHRDLDELLAAVCNRARLLLGTEAAYITLHDHPTGDTYVRMTTGIVSEEFRTMRLPWGKGLGGRIAMRAATQTTSDYAVDERLAHTESIDELVRMEGLRGIVGTPLRRGQEVLGVLMSGSRSARHFEPAEIALFEALAHHAAIAIENARLLAGARDALEDVERANAEARAFSTRIQRSATLQEQLTTLALGGGGIPEVLMAIASAVRAPVSLADAEGTIVDMSSGDGSDGRAESEGPPLEVPITAGGERLGWLRCAAPGPDAEQRELLERGATVVAGLLLQLHAESAADHRRRAELVNELFDRERIDATAVRRRSARLRLDLDVDHVVVVARQPESATRWTTLRAERTAAAEHGAVGSIDGRIVVLVPDTDARAAARRWSALLTGSDGSAPTLGAGGPARGIPALAHAYAQAVRALDIVLALGHEGRVVTLDDLGLFGLVLGRGDRTDLRGFLESTLGPVAAHDRLRTSDLMGTLEAFFAEAGHMANTALALGIHVNTLYQRLGRLEAILGADWRDPDHRLELHLALRLWRLDERLATGDPLV